METVLVVLLVLVLAVAVGHLVARWTWPIRARWWRRRAYIVEYEAWHTPDSGLEDSSGGMETEPDEDLDH